ncbi:MAG: hypothetical protein JJT96_10915 [Opitutales bacterium]|nr:hypothetical protein [Opitutales bacterium]
MKADLLSDCFFAERKKNFLGRLSAVDLPPWAGGSCGICVDGSGGARNLTFEGALPGANAPGSFFLFRLPLVVGCSLELEAGRDPCEVSFLLHVELLPPGAHNEADHLLNQFPLPGELSLESVRAALATALLRPLRETLERYIRPLDYTRRAWTETAFGGALRTRLQALHGIGVAPPAPEVPVITDLQVLSATADARMAEERARAERLSDEFSEREADCLRRKAELEGELLESRLRRLKAEEEGKLSAFRESLERAKRLADEDEAVDGRRRVLELERLEAQISTLRAREAFFGAQIDGMAGLDGVSDSIGQLVREVASLKEGQARFAEDIRQFLREPVKAAPGPPADWRAAIRMRRVTLVDGVIRPLGGDIGASDCLPSGSAFQFLFESSVEAYAYVLHFGPYHEAGRMGYELRLLYGNHPPRNDAGYPFSARENRIAGGEPLCLPAAGGAPFPRGHVWMLDTAPGWECFFALLSRQPLSEALLQGLNADGAGMRGVSTWDVVGQGRGGDRGLAEMGHGITAIRGKLEAMAPSTLLFRREFRIFHAPSL